jgi:IS30 family transposase
LPEFKPASAAHVLQAFTDKLLSIAEPMRQSMTYDQGREISMQGFDVNTVRLDW